MSPDFADYAHTDGSGQALVSKMSDEEGASGRMRLYGEGSASSQSLVGFSFHRQESWSSTDIHCHQPQLKALWTLAQRADVPLVWVGEINGGFSHTSNQIEVGPIRQSSDTFDADIEEVSVGEFAEWLWSILTVTTSTPSHAKSFNKQSIDGFHDWAQDQLGLTTIDADLITLNGTGVPNTLTEIKRSGYEDIEDWYPVIGPGGDEPNYQLQMDTARRTNIAPLVVCHDQVNVRADIPVYLYDLRGNSMNKVRKLNPWRVDTSEDFTYDRQRMRALDALSEVLSQ